MASSATASSPRNSGTFDECKDYRSLTTKDAIALVENKYRFPVKGSVNYIFSRFHLRTQRRDIMFEGALNLHEIVGFIISFAENYVETGKAEYLYMFHVIYDHSSECISKFDGYESKEKREEEIRAQLLRIVDFFDCVFSVFFNEKRKQKTKYRNDTPFEVLERAYNDYTNVILPELKREYNI
jgi:hypothetical protein